MTTIAVTYQNLACGLPGDPIHCPIALAVRESDLIPAGHRLMRVTSAGIAYAHHKAASVAQVIPLPPAAVKLLLDFDNGIPVAPITFTVEAAYTQPKFLRNAGLTASVDTLQLMYAKLSEGLEVLPQLVWKDLPGGVVDANVAYEDVRKVYTMLQVAHKELKEYIDRRRRESGLR